jgi:hypothetical protein
MAKFFQFPIHCAQAFHLVAFKFLVEAERSYIEGFQDDCSANRLEGDKSRAIFFL